MTDSKGLKKAWARLIQKIYEVDPFICPKCGSEMKIVAVIQDKSAIEKIISHLEKKRAPPEEMLVSKIFLFFYFHISSIFISIYRRDLLVLL